MEANDPLTGSWSYRSFRNDPDLPVEYLVPIWPHGINQRPAMMGSVIRTVPHSGGQAKAGGVASFIAVRQS